MVNRLAAVKPLVVSVIHEPGHKKSLLLLRIADINLLFKPALKSRFIKTGTNYRNFIRKDVTNDQNNIIDCTLSIEEHLPTFNIKGKEIFSHTGPWKLYSAEGSYIIAFFSPPSSNDYYMIAELNKDFSRGRIYIRETRKKTFIVSHPLDQLLIINLLSRGRGVMLHSCCVNDNGRGFLFAGTSRSGKSTTARLWLDKGNVPPSPPINTPPPLKGGENKNKSPLPLWERVGVRGTHEKRDDSLKGVKILSDDRIIIRQIDNKIFAYGTPWHGEVDISDPGRVEIEKILFLQHSEKNYVKPLSPVDAATRMFVRCFPTFWDKEGMAFTLKFIDEVVRKTPCYEFGFVPDKSAIEFVRGL